MYVSKIYLVIGSRVEKMMKATFYHFLKPPFTIINLLKIFLTKQL